MRQEIIAQRGASGFVLLTIHYSANKSRKTRRVKHVGQRARTERHAGFCWEKLKNKESLNDLCVDRITLKWISNRIERRGLD